MSDKVTSKTVAQPKERILYFDVLNVVACLAVVFLHHNGLFHKYTADNVHAWRQALAVEVAGFFAVPIFLMISGATLMAYRRRYNTRIFFQKRLSRVLIPFIVWSILTFIYALWSGKYTSTELNIVSVWNILMSSDMMSVYWFFPVIISIYFAMPILSLLTEPKHRKWLWYMAVVGFVTYSVLPPVCKLLGLQFNTGYQLPITGGGFIIFPIIGYLLATEKAIRSKWLILVSSLALASLTLRYIVTYYLTIETGATNYVLSSYTYFVSVVPAIALFMLAMRVPWSRYVRGKLVNVLTAVSSCSLGIYLIHILIMDIEMRTLKISDSSVTWRIFMPLATYVICLGIVWIAKRAGTISRLLFP